MGRWDGGGLQSDFHTQWQQKGRGEIAEMQPTRLSERVSTEEKQTKCANRACHLSAPASGASRAMAQNNAAVAPFPPPPKFYEAFEPHSNKQFQCPPPPPPIEGPYVMFGTLYDTSFAPQPPHAALAEKVRRRMRASVVSASRAAGVGAGDLGE
eukprot:748933-Hanusia_phi.AAC.3